MRGLATLFGLGFWVIVAMRHSIYSHPGTPGRGSEPQGCSNSSSLELMGVKVCLGAVGDARMPCLVRLTAKLFRGWLREPSRSGGTAGRSHGSARAGHS